MTSSGNSSIFEASQTTAQKASRRLRFGFGRKLPVILQADPAESGLACLAMLASYHGHLADLADLRHRFATSLKGMTAKTVVEIGEALHLDARATRVERKQLGQLTLPCILHWDMNHFVVLKQVLSHGRGIVIHDPALGEIRVRRSELARRFTSVSALEFTPNAGFATQDSPRPAGISWMTGKLVGLPRAIAQVAVLALSVQVFALAAPLFMQWVVDGGITSGDRELVGTLALGLALLIGVHCMLGMLRSWVVLHVLSQFNLQWASNVFTHVLRLPIGYFNQRPLGEVTSRYQAVQGIQQTVTTGFAESLLDGALAFTLLAAMAFYSPMLTLVVAGGAAAYAALRWALHRPLKRATEQQLALASREQSLFLESVQNMAAIRLFNHEQERRARWLDALVEGTNRQITTQKIDIALGTARTLLQGLTLVAVLWLGAGLATEQALTLGMLFAFVSFQGTFLQRFHGLVDRLAELKLLSLRADRLADIALAPPEQATPGLSRRKLLPQDATLELRGVWFRYADDLPWALQDVNLSFRAGEAAAIVGESGAGKSTLIKLMLGLLQPTRGEVLLGGVPIERLGQRTYRKLVGAVLQDDQLLAGSLLENISFFAERPSHDRLVTSATAAAVHEEIERMPLGYHTRVGGLGAGLSSGQRQRILLARALYKRPKLLFLDEATSHVDTKRENLINEALRDMAITRIIVAHRADAVRGIPRVVVIENGMVAKDLASVILTITDAVNDDTAAMPVLNKKVKSLR